MTLPLLVGFVSLELAAGLPLALALADPGRRAARALLLLAGLILLAALVLLASGAARAAPTLALEVHPGWLALAPRAVAAFAGAMLLALCLVHIGPTTLARLAMAFAGVLGLAALAVLDAVYGGALVFGAVLAPLLGAAALGHLVAALALACRAWLTGLAVEPVAQIALSLGVGALALQGFLLLGHVALGLPGARPWPLLHVVGSWFWLRLGIGLALPLALGLLAQRVDPRRPALLAGLLVALMSLLALGELASRVLLIATGVLF